MIIFSWILSFVRAKHTYFKSLLCQNCEIWRDKCFTKVGELCKIIHVLNFHSGTCWHCCTIHIWSRVLFLSSLKPNKDFFVNFFWYFSLWIFKFKYNISFIFNIWLQNARRKINNLCTLNPEQMSKLFTKFTLRRAQMHRA